MEPTARGSRYSVVNLDVLDKRCICSSLLPLARNRDLAFPLFIVAVGLGNVEAGQAVEALDLSCPERTVSVFNISPDSNKPPRLGIISKTPGIIGKFTGAPQLTDDDDPFPDLNGHSLLDTAAGRTLEESIIGPAQYEFFILQFPELGKQLSSLGCFTAPAHTIEGVSHVSEGLEPHFIPIPFHIDLR